MVFTIFRQKNRSSVSARRASSPNTDATGETTSAVLLPGFSNMPPSKRDVGRLLRSLEKSNLSGKNRETVLGMACRTNPEEFLDFAFSLFVVGESSFRGKSLRALVLKTGLEEGYAGFFLSEGIASVEDVLKASKLVGGIFPPAPSGKNSDAVCSRLFDALASDVRNGGVERLPLHSELLKSMGGENGISLILRYGPDSSTAASISEYKKVVEEARREHDTIQELASKTASPTFFRM